MLLVVLGMKMVFLLMFMFLVLVEWVVVFREGLFRDFWFLDVRF